jgi:hypothetical protein
VTSKNIDWAYSPLYEHVRRGREELDVAQKEDELNFLDNKWQTKNNLIEVHTKALNTLKKLKKELSLTSDTNFYNV